MAQCLLAAMDAEEEKNYEMMRGILAQTMRWLVLDIENPKDALMSWRLTFQPDPVPMMSPTKVASQLDLNISLLDPAQLTSSLGMARDMDLIAKRLKGEAPKNPKAFDLQFFFFEALFVHHFRSGVYSTRKSECICESNFLDHSLSLGLLKPFACAIGNAARAGTAPRNLFPVIINSTFFRT